MSSQTDLNAPSTTCSARFAGYLIIHYPGGSGQTLQPLQVGIEFGGSDSIVFWAHRRFSDWKNDRRINEANSTIFLSWSCGGRFFTPSHTTPFNETLREVLSRLHAKGRCAPRRVDLKTVTCYDEGLLTEVTL
jgi:hypothetical protein